MTNKSRKTHLEKVFNLLERKQVTVSDARKVGVTRLAARIHELRGLGYNIYTNRKTVNGRAVTAYRLAL